MLIVADGELTFSLLLDVVCCSVNFEFVAWVLLLLV